MASLSLPPGSRAKYVALQALMTCIRGGTHIHLHFTLGIGNSITNSSESSLLLCVSLTFPFIPPSLIIPHTESNHLNVTNEKRTRKCDGNRD